MSEGSSNQLHIHSESAAMLALQCPLEPSTFLEALRSSGLRILEEIEKHISASKCHHPPLKDLTLHGSLDGSTPLLLACYFGDLDRVKHLIENWGVDWQAPGVYYSNPLYSKCDKIEVATPLFVAASNLHFKIVQYMIVKGADPNGKGNRLKDVEGPTPLQGVLSNDFQPEIRAKIRAIVCLLLESGADPNVTDGRPIWMEPSCSAKITTKLVRYGLKLDQRTDQGDTILHDRIKRVWSYLEPRKCNREMALIRRLVNNGANLMARNSEGLTPILLASTKESWPLLRYMLERGEIPSQEKIYALEIAAATILSSNDGNLEQERAFGYLRQALRLRQTGQLHMTPLKLKRGRTVGWTTSAQLDQVIAEPAEYRLQSYLTQLRILSDRSHESSNTLWKFLLGCIYDLKEQNRLEDLLDVLWATFEKIQLCLSDMHHECGCWRMADDVIVYLVWAILQLGENDRLYSSETFRSILKVLLVTDRAHSGFCSDKCYTNLQLPSNMRSHMGTLLRIVTFLSRLPEEILNDDQKQQEISIKNLLSQLVIKKSHSKRGKLLLHRACDVDNLDLATIRLLLQVNADPNAGDNDGNGPLHVLASLRYDNGQEHLIHRTADAARLLLDNGAHLDRVNQVRKTAADVWKQINRSQDLPVWLREPGSVPKLKCLSSRIIRSNKIAVTEENSPETLHPFVKWH